MASLTFVTSHSCAALRRVGQSAASASVLRTSRTAGRVARGRCSERTMMVAAAPGKGSTATSGNVSLPALDLHNEAPADFKPQDSALKPGEQDRAYFECRESVDFWRNINLGRDDAVTTLTNRVQESIRKDSSNAGYWAYYLGRTSFFAAQGFLSVTLSAVRRSIASNAPRQMLSNSSFRILLEAGHSYAQELETVKATDAPYKMPYDVLNASIRQVDPRFVLRQSLSYLSDAPSVLGRRAAEEKPDVSNWMDGSFYPDYYKESFHYQSDGWMSSESADRYDIQTETLFVGRQDAMQRLTLIPIGEYLKRQRDSVERPVMLEMAAGTGRLTTFVRDNFPQAEMVVSELSPFYLQKARENLSYWASTQSPKPEVQPKYLHAKAEQVPTPDESCDVVYIVFTFHELPAEARRDVVREARRVLKPGGLFVITDSVQVGDRDEKLDANLPNFGNFNEPHYRSYLNESLGKLVIEEVRGFRGWTKEVMSVSKMVSFIKE